MILTLKSMYCIYGIAQKARRGSVISSDCHPAGCGAALAGAEYFPLFWQTL